MVNLAVRYPHGVLVFVLAVLVLGFAVIREMPTDVLPVYKKPAVQVLTMYPGMPAVNVEKDITIWETRRKALSDETETE